MKTKLLILFLLWAGMMYGQKCSKKKICIVTCKCEKREELKKCTDRKNQVIVYDFLKGQFDESVIKPCQRVPTILKIKNINTYFYDIQIQANDVSIISDNNENPIEVKKQNIIKIDTTSILNMLDSKAIQSFSSFTNSKNSKSNDYKNIEKVLGDLNVKQLKLRNKGNELSNEENEKKEVEKIISLKEKLSTIDTIKKKSEYDELSLKELKTDLDKIKTSFKTECKDVNDCQKIVNSKNDKIKTIKLDLVKIESDISTEENKLEKLYLNLKDKNEILYKVDENVMLLNAKYFDLDLKFIEVLKIAGAYNNYINKIYRPGINKEEYSKIGHSKVKFETISILNLDSLSNYHKKINDFNKLYSNFQHEYNKQLRLNDLLLSNNTEDLIYYKRSIRSEYDRIKNVTDQMFKKLENLNLSSRLSSIEIYNRELQNESTFEYVSDPIQGLGDYIEFDVKIKPKTPFKEVLAKNQNRSFKYSEYLRGGIRYDFSVGTVFDFINRENFYENRNDTIRRTSNNKYHPTLAGLFHVSFRSNSLCSFGLSLGASLNITEFDINSLFFGPSLLIGKKEKIILTSGLSFRKTKQLERGHYDGEKIPGASNIDDYLTNNFRLGLFVGISYNLTKKQKSSLKIASPTE